MKVTIIGIDISKQTLDLAIIQNKKVIDQLEILNDGRQLKALIDHYSKQGELIIGMENTGRYNWPVYECIIDFSNVYVIPPLQLKKSLGLSRGKSDKIDALRIARYVELHRQRLQFYKQPANHITQVHVLLSKRSAKVKQLRQIKAAKTENNLIDLQGIDYDFERDDQQIIDLLKAQIKCIEQTIEQIIKSDEQLYQQARIIRSIPGFGKVVSWYLLVKTNQFKNFESSRKFACYAGIVPFEHSSGTSLKNKARLSFYADKEIKSLLHMAAMRSIQIKSCIQQYYQRKVGEGKNKMSVLNAVRNKLITICFALIKNNSLFQFNYQNHLEVS